MELLKLHRGQHIIAGILLSIMIHATIIQASVFSEEKILADIFTPKNIVSFQLVKRKKNIPKEAIPKPVFIEKSTKHIIKEIIVEEVIEEVPEEPILETPPKQENIIPVITEIKLKGKRIAPKYPKRSLRLKQQGVVLINVLIGTNGKQQKMLIVKSSKYPLLDKSALEAVSQWQFSPTMQNGIPILSWVQVPIEFLIQ